MVDRVVINDATYGTLLNHVLGTQGPSDALLLGQVRVIQENVIDDRAENLIKSTKEVTVACALCFPDAQGLCDRNNHVNLDAVASALTQASPQCTQNTYVVGWAALRRRHPADRFSAQEKALAASLVQCIPALYDISAKQSGSHCRTRSPPCPVPCICLDMRLSDQAPGVRDGPTLTPMLQCDVVAHEVEIPSTSKGQAGTAQRALGGSQWNVVKLHRRPVILRSLRDIGAESLYSSFRPHIAGDISFMHQQEALDMQNMCRQQSEMLYRHCANGVAHVHSKATELLTSWKELQALESLADHCAKLVPPMHPMGQAS
eukprot:jgi/Ulvmu1/10179/UM006_0135.1